MNKPNAVRAVAAANGANRIAIVIPCHRIIGKDGKMTGYGGGISRKEWLIEHERNNV
jgi:AraC family transcriptional regulator of adaptative response/methylated-DNA-[protein]-cysteine methyltransferase